MKRSRRGASEPWTEIGWPEAAGLVASHLSMLRGRGEPQSLLVLHGRPLPLEQMLWTRFCEAFGTPNYFAVNSPDLSAVAGGLMHGTPAQFGYDLENSNYILSFGCDLLEGWRSRVDAIRTYGYLRHERSGAKAKLVQIDRRFSTTAGKADEWVPVRPMTEGALALAIAHVIVQEKLYDRDFIGSSTSGFEEWSAFVAKEYRPGDAAMKTGVPADTITRIAHEFAENRPAVAISDMQATSSPMGAHAALAIHALNALVGNLNAVGGVSLAQTIPLKELPAFETDAAAKTGRSMPPIGHAHAGRFPLGRGSIEAIPDAILSGSPYRIGAVFLRNFDPMDSSRISAEFRHALESIPLVVSFSSRPDGATELADLILPDHTCFEKWIGANVTPISGAAVFNVAAPVIGPLYGTMQTEDFILQMARSLDASIASAFPWNSFKELLQFVAEGIYAKNGKAKFDSYDDFWKAMLKRGGFWTTSRSRQDAAFNTASGKFDFRPDLLSPLAGLSPGAKDPYRFFLNPVGLDSVDCPASTLPWIEEIEAASTEWESWAEIDPHTARDLGIRHGEPVLVETHRGKFKARARVYAGAVPGVVNVPGGHAAIKNILDLEYDRLSGDSAWFSTWAKISKA